MFGVPFIGALDFRSLDIDYLLEFLVGGLLFAFGLGIDIWGTKTLSGKQSMGDTGEIITGGPYRYTRNPQYVGFIILFTGIIFLTASFMALITGGFEILLFLIIPFSEEPWLKEKYGKPYENYCRIVPRFIGFRSLKNLRKCP
jgi:protein-S-isoprenylcysteine O-methyltransferase Ste14